MEPQELTILEDLPGERLVLGVPGRPPLGERVRETLREWRRTIQREWAEALLSPRHFVGLLGALLLLLLCGALILFACVLVVIALGLIVLLFEIGVWMVAWWLVWAAAKYVIIGRLQPPKTHRNLRRFSANQEGQTLRWEAAGETRAVGFSELEGLQLQVEPNPGGNSSLTLEIRAKEGHHQLRFSALRLDREEESLDLLFRLARILRWPSYTAERQQLQGLRIALFPAPLSGASAHPFRDHAAEEERHPVPSREYSAEDWSIAPIPGFREPSPPLPAFVPPRKGFYKVPRWEPGTGVKIEVTPSFRPRRILAGQAAAALVGAAIVAGVVLLGAAPQGQIVFRGDDHRHTVTYVFALLAAVSCAFGWLLTFGLWWKRVGRVDAEFSWEGKTLNYRSDESAEPIPFSKITQITLHELKTPHRYIIDAQVKDRAPLRIYESRHEGDGGHLPPLCFTVDLARALGVPWRCIAAPET